MGGIVEHVGNVNEATRAHRARVTVSLSLCMGNTRRAAATPLASTPWIEASRIRSPSTIDTTLISAAHSVSARSPMIEHWLDVGGRAADDAEHIGGGRLLLERLLQLARVLLLDLEQARVFDGDHRWSAKVAIRSICLGVKGATRVR